jgi:hypothetical protein
MGNVHEWDSNNSLLKEEYATWCKMRKGEICQKATLTQQVSRFMFPELWLLLYMEKWFL